MKRISSNSSFEREYSYSRAIINGPFIFISGTTGYDYKNMFLPEGIEGQCEQCFKNIEETLLQAGASMSNIVRIQYILPKASDFEKCRSVINSYLNEVKPAATMFEAGLLNDEMKIEIQVTAMK